MAIAHGPAGADWRAHGDGRLAGRLICGFHDAPSVPCPAGSDSHPGVRAW
ncbi:hypothetical protein DVS28_a2816 [Euzebya pacifica]|uniref:Uncharacterized protein n=1 Tax=Euzebya pacifica TaxID=1608957 RepID=A0A346XZ48_9ACTN|nr:hypothetical protein DVS28_a2816 [Euzebya pacifica]